MKTPHIKLIGQSPSRLGFFLIPLALACFALSPTARADCQIGCLTGTNTALGDDALINTTGTQNTAVGFQALQFNTEGFDNTATGMQALIANTMGNSNTATGRGALELNTSGNVNTANGVVALAHNSTGDSNVAIGWAALIRNETGNNNIAVGALAGFFTEGSNNIEIGHRGFAGDSGTIRIGTTGTQNHTYIAGISAATVPNGVGVIVGPNGNLGTLVSSARFKQAIKPMDEASEVILALKPVTFQYKKEFDPDGIPQFGLLAEEVEKVNPDLVARDEQGKPYTVRYEAVNAMLLNEFLKVHKAFVEEQRKVQEQGATIARLEKQVETLTAGVQKVSAQLELSKPAPQTVLNNR